MKYSHLILASVLCFGLVKNASPDTEGPVGVPLHGFYINAGLGAVFSNTRTRFSTDSNAVLFSPTSIGTSLFSLPNITLHNQFKNGYDINLSVGQHINAHWRGDLEFLYQNIQRNTFGHYDWLEQNSITGATFARQNDNPISTIASRADIYAFFTNAAYDFGHCQPLNPFVSAGIGMAWIKSGSAQTNNQLSIDDPTTPLMETAPALQNSPSLYGTAFAWQLKAGIQYVISELATAVLQYRLVNTTDFKGSTSSILTNEGTPVEAVFSAGQHDIKGLLTQAIDLSLRFDF